ncbi:MAG: hypothetical protein AB7U83_20705 [Vicinamibacterales bacterium]
MSAGPLPPAQVIAAIERGGPVPDGPGERYLGYGVLGVAFASGDLLALRRFPVASSGCGYTAVWHRQPNGAWTFYTDATSGQGCTSHFAPALDTVEVAPIRLEWDGPWSLTVGVDGGRAVSWRLTLAATWPTRLLSAAAAALPEAVWHDARGLGAIAAVARAALGTGPLRLSGHLPSGARFLSNPRRLWAVVGSRAAVHGVDLGAMTTPAARLALGEFQIPRVPLVASGPLFIEPPPATDATTAVARGRDESDRDPWPQAG